MPPLATFSHLLDSLFFESHGQGDPVFRTPTLCMVLYPGCCAISKKQSRRSSREAPVLAHPGDADDLQRWQMGSRSRAAKKDAQGSSASPTRAEGQLGRLTSPQEKQPSCRTLVRAGEGVRNLWPVCFWKMAF